MMKYKNYLKEAALVITFGEMTTVHLCILNTN